MAKEKMLCGYCKKELDFKKPHTLVTTTTEIKTSQDIYYSNNNIGIFHVECAKLVQIKLLSIEYRTTKPNPIKKVKRL
jgi:hypothetical protein